MEGFRIGGLGEAVEHCRDELRVAVGGDLDEDSGHGMANSRDLVGVRRRSGCVIRDCSVQVSTTDSVDAPTHV